MPDVSPPKTCFHCGAPVEIGEESFNQHILICPSHKYDDEELRELKIDPEKCVHRNQNKFLGGFDIIQKYAREMKVRKDDGTNALYHAVVSEYVHHTEGILRVDYTSKAKGVTEHTVRPLLRCNFRLLSKIHFNEMEDAPHSWNITIDNRPFTGAYDTILSEIEKSSMVVGSKEEARQALSHILSVAEVPTQSVYPCVGLFITEQKKAVYVSGSEVYPMLDSQKSVMRITEHKEKGYAALAANKDEYNVRRKAVMEATRDLIESMPTVNRIPAIIARGYCTIAPIAYELKKSTIGIFPYLYLYGPMNSSKTQIAKACATRTFGEMDGLNNDSVDSAFRLGQEFSATKFPRLVDEAQNIFMRNQSIFKSAATGPLATKRGNRDLNMRPYSAFCTFIFTSNVEPISAEEDAQGSVMDRVVVIPCASGTDFSPKLYRAAMGALFTDSFIYGRAVIDHLLEMINDPHRGIDWLEREIMARADEISVLYPQVQQRRAYGLGEILFGIDMYLDIMEKNGVNMGANYANRKKVHLDVLEAIQAKATVDQKTFLRSLVEWLRTHTSDPRASLLGVIRDETGQYIITNNTLRYYGRAFNTKLAITSTDGLLQELKRIGIDVKQQNHVFSGFSVFGIRVNLDDVEKNLSGVDSKYEESTNSNFDDVFNQSSVL